MKYFEQYFADVDFNTGDEEVKVLCPFHNDTNPSAFINTNKSLFHCFVCQEGYNEKQFISKINNISLKEAEKVLNKIKESQTYANWRIEQEAQLWADYDFLEKVKTKLQLTEETIKNLKLGLEIHNNNKFLAFPVLYNNSIMDVRTYNILKIDGVSKVKSQKGAKSGFIIPYDEWITNNDTTYIMEGEKDMALARELGLNAITITGGAGAKPNELVFNSFKDREIIICYDNDKAGEQGTLKLFRELKKIAKSVKQIKLGEVVENEKEDFFDYIVKYNNSIFDFLSLNEYEIIDKNPPKKKYITLQEALSQNKIKQFLTSKVTINAEFSDTFSVPQTVRIEKVEEISKSDSLFVGEVKHWELEEKNVFQMLGLIEVDAKTSQVMNKIKSFLDIPTSEKGLKIKSSNDVSVYKSRMIDADTIALEINKNITIDLYSFKPLEVGKQYEIRYKIYPHPTKHQKLVAIATDTKELDCDNDFKPDKNLLSKLQTKGTIEEKINKLYQSAKHHIAKHLNFELWLMNDLVFNSILEFEYADLIRGALDVFVLGDTRAGKSETAEKLTQLYNFGHFLSLKTATTTGLIGGSNKVEGSFMNTIGAIPRQHKKLVVLEEFSGAKPDFVKTMTELRSSGFLRLTRVAGELRVPCRVRTITISNPINDEQGNPRHLSTFPNGVMPIMELIKSSEDVARYDGFFLVEKPKNRKNPFTYQLKGEAIPKEVYEHKAKWVQTRKAEDVIFEENVESYIWEKAEDLNALFECNFPLFGTTSSQKLARFSVAMASLIVNTDETYSKVIVTQECVDYAFKFLVKVYDNSVFKLKEYKDHYESYYTITEEELEEFQRLYWNHSTLFDYLNNQTDTTRGNLRSISGLKNDDFSSVFNKMVKLKLIKLSRETVYPTDKFRIAMNKTDMSISLDSGDNMLDN